MLQSVYHTMYNTDTLVLTNRLSRKWGQ